jgi:hypothetical protein
VRSSTPPEYVNIDLAGIDTVFGGYEELADFGQLDHRLDVHVQLLSAEALIALKQT